VHARDVIDRLKAASKNKVGVNSFEWTSQLRFYFDRSCGDFGKCVVKQTNTSFQYGYEVSRKHSNQGLQAQRSFAMTH